MKKNLAFACAAAVLLAAGLVSGWFYPHAVFAIVLRWTGLGLFVPFAVRRRSLLVWTFFRRPSHFSLAVALSIYGYHFRKTCRVLGL